MKLFFLDESGDHSLEHIDRDYPVFVLGGIVVDRHYYRTEVVPQLDELKRQFFGRSDLIIHTLDLIRARNGFEALTDRNHRDAFFRALNELMQNLDYTVIACAIHKQRHLDQYGARAADPYEYSLETVIERFCHDLNGNEAAGVVFAEKRRPDLDDALDHQWMRLCRSGTDYVNGDSIDHCIVDLSTKSKKINIAGLQMADLVVSPIGRHIIGKPDRPDWTIVESKFRRKNGRYLGYGLKMLP